MRNRPKVHTVIGILWCLACLSLSTATAQIVNIPDANFKFALLSYHTGIDLNEDGEIQVDEAADYTGHLWVNGSGISDLTGIEAFTSITELRCNSNNLTSIDVSSNTALTSLNCMNNQLTALDVSNNPFLTYLNCARNSLTALDLGNNPLLNVLECWDNSIVALDVSTNSALVELRCWDNLVSALDVSGCPLLTHLLCWNNQLTALNVSQNGALRQLYCTNNSISEIDLSNNADLLLLGCSENQLAELDLSGNLMLQGVGAANNLLSALDVSGNHQLTFLTCFNNELTALNVRNGNNLNFSGSSGGSGIAAENNPNLLCIEVDDPEWAEANWSANVDPWASFSEGCAIIPGIPGTSESQTVEGTHIFPNPATSNLTVLAHGHFPNTIAIYSCLGKKLMECPFVPQLDIQSLPNGMYVLELHGDKAHERLQFVKH